MEFLVFTVNKQQCGVRIDEMITIQLLPVLTTVPGSPEAVSGMFSFQDELIPVVDLSLMYQDEATQDPKFVVITKGRNKYGILVNCIGNIVRNELPENALLLGVCDIENTALTFDSSNKSSTIELF